jgi:hypothetical protein
MEDSQNTQPVDTPRCLCTRAATCVIRIHYQVRWTRDVARSIAGPPQHACARCAGGVVSNHAEPGESPITVTVAPIEATP